MALSCPIDLLLLGFRRAELLGTLGSVGFVGVEPCRRFDCFYGTSKERIARKFEMIGITVVAMKPLR